jgi:hypothetical protein
MAAGSTVLAQKAGGTLRVYSPDSPATMSILEEATIFAVGPMMGVFNNLTLFDQSVKQVSLQSIVRDRVGVERGRLAAHLPAPPRRQVA